ncbi:MAG: hypothetical protein ACR2PL_13330 [Dehalococcoidia bacterium]
MNTPLAELFRYNRWANLMLLNAYRTLSDEQLDALLDVAARSSDDMIAIAEDLALESEVGLAYLSKTHRFPKSFFLAHAMEHGVEHRMEVKPALFQLGSQTPDLDAWSYRAAMGYGQEV